MTILTPLAVIETIILLFVVVSVWAAAAIILGPTLREDEETPQ